MKKGKRILAAFLAVLMVVAIMPFTSFSGIFTSKAKAAESGTVSYKLADAGLAAKITSTVQAGTDDYFTINATSSKAVETADKEKTFEDGTKIKQTLKMGSGNQGNITSRSISFTVKTGTTATVSVYGIASGGKNADGNYTVIGLYNSEGNLVKTSDKVMAETTPVTTFDITEAGTYYIADYKATDAASTYKGLNIYGVTVKEKTSGSSEVTRKEWSLVEAPKITNVKQEGSKVIVDFDAVVGDDGADKISVTMTDPEGKQTVNNSTKKGENASVEFTPSYTGKYVFSITAIRADENDKEGNTVEFMYALPLSAPSISSATSMGNGTVSLVWQSVKEATSYNVYVGGTKVGSTSAKSYFVPTVNPVTS